MISQNTPIKVFNYSANSIGLKGQLREYYLEGSRGMPTVLTMFFSEVEYINARSSVFSSGALRFDPLEQDEIYNALNLPNWKDTVLFDEEIDRIIIEADLDGLQRIIDVKDIFTAERIRGHMIGLRNSPDHDISNRVIDLIDRRYDEINRGVRNTKLSVLKTEKQMKSEQDPRVSELEKQLAEIQAQMAEFMKSQSASKKPQRASTRSKKTEPEVSD